MMSVTIRSSLIGQKMIDCSLKEDCCELLGIVAVSHGAKAVLRFSVGI